MTFAQPPAADQIEVSLFGPGKGECCVVHLGDGKWIIIDSCINSETGEPVALDYLSALGFNPDEAVLLIIATHWHDDHIGGIARVFGACPKADFCAANALTTKEFLAVTSPYEHRSLVPGGSGVKEIFEVMEQSAQFGRPLIRASPNRCVLKSSGSAHGRDIEITTLSPSDAQFEKFLADITSLMPEVRMTRRRPTPNLPNHLSVVTWISIGETSMLLGGDLEETSEADTGWSVIVGSTARPAGRATTYKVPHHGSDNAHSDEVWAKMLEEERFAVLTPYNRGHKKRPSSSDAKRICTLTPEAYVTAGIEGGRSRRRRSPVQRSIDEVLKEPLRLAEAATGCVRIRNEGRAGFEKWSVELFDPAMHLSRLYPP